MNPGDPPKPAFDTVESFAQKTRRSKRRSEASLLSAAREAHLSHLARILASPPILASGLYAVRRRNRCTNRSRRTGRPQPLLPQPLRKDCDSRQVSGSPGHGLSIDLQILSTRCSAQKDHACPTETRSVNGPP